MVHVGGSPFLVDPQMGCKSFLQEKNQEESMRNKALLYKELFTAWWFQSV